MCCEGTAGLAESNGSLPPGLWLTSPAGWLPRTGISSGTLRSVIEYGLPLPFYWKWPARGTGHCANCIGALSFPICGAEYPGGNVRWRSTAGVGGRWEVTYSRTGARLEAAGRQSALVVPRSSSQRQSRCYPRRDAIMTSKWRQTGRHHVTRPCSRPRCGDVAAALFTQLSPGLWRPYRASWDVSYASFDVQKDDSYTGRERAAA